MRDASDTENCNSIHAESMEYSTVKTCDKLHCCLSCTTQLVDQLVNPEDDSSHFMRILVESLAILNKLPEAAEVCVTLDLTFIS